jgi:hypothetical protein
MGCHHSSILEENVYSLYISALRTALATKNPNIIPRIERTSKKYVDLHVAPIRILLSFNIYQENPEILIKQRIDRMEGALRWTSITIYISNGCLLCNITVNEQDESTPSNIN